MFKNVFQRKKLFSRRFTLNVSNAVTWAGSSGGVRGRNEEARK